MKYYTFGLNRYTLLFSLSLLLTTIHLTSCGDKKDPKPEEVSPPDDTTPTDQGMFYKVIRVENLKGSQDNDFNAPAPTIFYSLETNKLIEKTYQQTNRWDLALSGLFNSFLAGNNGTNSTNPGYGNSSRGGITIVEKSFNDVIDIPADSEFKTAGSLIGTDDNGDMGQGIGWYFYDFYGSKVRAGKVQDAHVAYALSEPLKLKDGNTVLPRTIILRTAKGNYAKIKMISCYKDLYTQASWYKDAPHMYFTFEYILIPKGAKKFEIKN